MVEKNLNSEESPKGGGIYVFICGLFEDVVSSSDYIAGVAN
jgi:hypothetical protein